MISQILAKKTKPFLEFKSFRKILKICRAASLVLIVDEIVNFYNFFMIIEMKKHIGILGAYDKRFNYKN